MTDINPELKTLSDRAILLQMLARQEHLELMVQELHQGAQELLPHARRALAAKERVGKLLGGKRGQEA